MKPTATEAMMSEANCIDDGQDKSGDWRDSCSRIEDLKKPVLSDLPLRKAGETIPLFDEASVMERLFGDRDLVCSVLPGFAEDMISQIAQLKAFLEINDLASLRRQAHSIKGAASYVSAYSMSDIAHRLEHAAAKNDIDSIRTLVPELDSVFLALTSYLRQNGWLQES
jgi:HPt (histidine-containing phosphotransfer) domain-containing protein